MCVCVLCVWMNENQMNWRRSIDFSWNDTKEIHTLNKNIFQIICLIFLVMNVLQLQYFTVPNLVWIFCVNTFFNIKYYLLLYWVAEHIFCFLQTYCCSCPVIGKGRLPKLRHPNQTYTIMFFWKRLSLKIMNNLLCLTC